MDALPAELVAPIVKLVNPESLTILKSILRPNTPWSLSVDHALEPRFDLYITVLYLRGFDCKQNASDPTMLKSVVNENRFCSVGHSGSDSAQAVPMSAILGANDTEQFNTKRCPKR
uniref:F-box domain-containing protein n=1 Tax=Steinernema glaseri TaxID=37863 RepID=A0A1I7ZTT0_9BILA